MIATLGRTFVIFALSVSIGAHWFLLQSIAWGTMISRYSEEMPVVAAISKTFDGGHPCNLCKDISSVRQSQKNKNDVQTGPAKPDFICVTRPLVLLPRCRDFAFAHFEFVLQSRPHSPPTPPPRSALG